MSVSCNPNAGTIIPNTTRHERLCEFQHTIIFIQASRLIDYSNYTKICFTVTYDKQIKASQHHIIAT